MQEGRGAQVEQDHSVQRGALLGRRRKKALLFGLAAAVLVIDQASKELALAVLAGGRRISLIGDIFGLRLVFNPGSAFGLMKDFTFAIFIASSLVTVFVTVWALRDPAASPALGLIIGGGLGNLVDRVVRPPAPGRGEVVDSIYLSFWPTFNLADVAIVLGVGLMLLSVIKEERALHRAL